MVHNFKLSGAAFRRVLKKEQTLVLRAVDHRTDRLAVNDTIEFLNRDAKEQKLRVRILALHRFASTAALTAALPQEQYGYSGDETAEIGDAQEVVAIEFELMDGWRDAGMRDLGRYVSYLLRHHPESAGLTLDEHGWADVSALLRAIGKTRETLELLVETDAKQRYSFNAAHTKIRANQGHSVPVDAEPEEMTPPEFLWHGTAEKNRAGILEGGIRRGSRLHVHLSDTPEYARKVGQRHGKPFVFRVAAGAMHRDGYRFFRSANGVWLTEYVPPAYLESR